MNWLFLVACGGSSPGNRILAEKAGTAPVELRTQGGKYLLYWQSLPAPIPMGELFVIETTVYDGMGKILENGVVKVDARMPQHGHGMATRPIAAPPDCTIPVELGLLYRTMEQGKLPESCLYPGGKYRMEGMKFHMGGEWTLRFDVHGPAGSDWAELRYSL